MFGKLMERSIFFTASLLVASASSELLAGDIIHDAEYYVIEAQKGEGWEA